MRRTCHRVCERIGHRYRVVEGDPGTKGAGSIQESVAFADAGEDTVLLCEECNDAANQECVQSRLRQFQVDPDQKAMETVLGENLVPVEPLAAFLGIPVWKTTKTLIFEADEQIVAAMERGDCDANETTLASCLGCTRLRLASASLVHELTGAEVGYAGPVGLRSGVSLVADHHVHSRVNFECGANPTHWHHVNVNFGRDQPLPAFLDLTLAKEGERCPRCDGRLRAARGIRIGRVRRLGTRYSVAMDCCYVGPDGSSRPVGMGPGAA